MNSTMLPFAAIIMGLVLAGGGGCSAEKRAEVHPVQGTILVKGEPANHAHVVFHDTRAPADLKDLPIPRATTAADGAFRLSSYAAGDGAPAGSYRITVRVPGFVVPQGADPESAGDPGDRLGGRYADPTTTTLTCEVKPGDNQLPPFELN